MSRPGASSTTNAAWVRAGAWYMPPHSQRVLWSMTRSDSLGLSKNRRRGPLARHVYRRSSTGTQIASRAFPRVVPRMGMWLAGVELDPIKPGEQDWPRLSNWLQRTNHLAPLAPKVPVSLAAAPLPDWAAKVWGALSAAEQATRTIVPTDGLAFSNSPRVISSPPLAAADQILRSNASRQHDPRAGRLSSNTGVRPGGPSSTLDHW